MSDEPVTFTVLGRPQPAGSKKGFVNPKTGRVIITDDAKKSRPWKSVCSGDAHVAMAGRVLLDGPLGFKVTFYVQRPKSHFGTGRNARTLKDSAPAYPAVKPDTTKLVRAIEDALTGIVWRDDAQVVTQVAFKRYGEPERAEVTVWNV